MCFARGHTACGSTKSNLANRVARRKKVPRELRSRQASAPPASMFERREVLSRAARFRPASVFRFCSTSQAASLPAPPKLKGKGFVNRSTPELKVACFKFSRPHKLPSEQQLAPEFPKDRSNNSCGKWRKTGTPQHSRERPGKLHLRDWLRCHSVDRSGH